jgi:hypothetical protein
MHTTYPDTLLHTSLHFSVLSRFLFYSHFLQFHITTLLWAFLIIEIIGVLRLKKVQKSKKNFLAIYFCTSRKFFQISVLISKPFEKVQIRDKKIYGNSEVSLLTFMFPKLNNFCNFRTVFKISIEYCFSEAPHIYDFFKVDFLQTLKVKK